MAPIERTITIFADAAAIWKTLTEPERMKQWMGEPEMKIEIRTDWKENGPIVISGFHHVQFENRGTVLKFEPNRRLRYSHLNSISRLDDQPGNYTIIEFTLKPQNDQTSLTVVITNFPTETIYKHLDFYWRTTMEVIKNLAEVKK